jgi:hypothetical protein
MQSDWDALRRTTGPLRKVTKTVVVREAGNTRDEIEVLRFSDGYAGTPAARWVGDDITGLVILGGTTDRARHPPRPTTRSTSSAAGSASLKRGSIR